MSNIVDAKWLKENLNNEKLVIVDCRFSLMNKNYGKDSYEKAHIKGAVRVDIETELSSPVKEHGGRHPLPSVEELKNTFENIGISNDSIVVAYDEGDLSGPARLWWILKYLGHEKVYVLNGGINEFEKIGGEVTTEETTAKKGTFEVKLQEDLRVNMEYVKERLHKDNIAIVDCVFYDCDNPDFEEYVESFGFVMNFGSFSDISAICPQWKVAGVNLSIGYYNEHSQTETLNIGQMFSTIYKVRNMLDRINEAKAYEYIESKYAYRSIWNFPTDEDGWDPSYGISKEDWKRFMGAGKETCLNCGIGGIESCGRRDTYGRIEPCQ